MRNYSHSIITKITVFIIMILCFTGALNAFVHISGLNGGDLRVPSEEIYFQSREYVDESEPLIYDLIRLTGQYKNEEHILNGGTISEEEIINEEEYLYGEFREFSRSYNPNVSEEENYQKFKELSADKIAKAKESLIKDDLKEFHRYQQRLNNYEGLVYYASDGVNVFTNSTKKSKSDFKTYPSYLLFENYKSEIYPKEAAKNEYLDGFIRNADHLDLQNTVIYVAYTDDLLKLGNQEWQENKAATIKGLYQLSGFLVGLILSFFYLALVIGRKSFQDEKVHFAVVDRLYNDVNVTVCFMLMVLWMVLLVNIGFEHVNRMSLPITVPIAAVGFLLILSLVKHIKNRTLLRHSFIYWILSKIFTFVRNVYDSGSVGVKTVLLVIGYPLVVVLTFFMFPITLGVSAWFAFKKVKSFEALKEGVKKIKNGDLHHTIEVEGNGEFKRLSEDINSITDGLKNAVDSELKSERLKTELITNVSHDIRTPLTSIITYVDLLKIEKDPSKVEEYVEVLDQKSKRLKVLTDDLFEAAKASSGDIPVQLEKIDIVSLITQGLGEVDDKIEESQLDFKLHYPEVKVYMTADGRLLWRSIENLLSNIFKYALQGSRVYINIEETEDEILLTFKNISAYELNISADELMERFKRGDESRLSEGSGLGLSIAKSLIELQKGTFSISVDGDLFKVMITMPKYHNE